MKYWLAPLVLFSATSIYACSGTSTTPNNPSDSGTEEEDATTDEDSGTPDAEDKDSYVDPGPKSCDPYELRKQALEVFIGPTGFEKLVVAKLKAAQSSIDIMIYQIGTTAIVNEIVAAHKRGVKVRVIQDRNQTKYGKPQLVAGGVDVKDSPAEFNHYHPKVLILDKKEALVMSMNLTDFSTKGERNYGVVDKSAGDIEDLQKIFERDWTGSGDVDLSCTQLVVSPQNAKARLVDLIKKAKTTLDLSVMYITERDTFAAVLERAKAGVAVRVLLANPAWIADNANTAATLKAASIPVKYFTAYDLHAKLIISDGVAFIGSENFSYNALTSNREVGVFASETSEIAKTRKQFEADFAAGVEP